RYPMSFGENLKFLRNRKGLSQTQLADLLNTSQQHISQLEKGVREPNLQDIKLFSTIFELPADFLIQDSPCEYNVTNLDFELWILLNNLLYDEKILIRDLLLLISHQS
ncbi:MAG: helix-turn-helix transcriptional regulator, partial [Vagococcus sp.]